ncbi:MAG TPA: N-acetylmuramoyl-L-alanine amidase [Coleofasciculaceae cyanobacterium]
MVASRLFGDRKKSAPKTSAAAVGLLGLLGSLVAALPAEAGQLLNWRFDAARNQLSFTTDEGVQPRAQIVTGPDRLVIDLPDTTVGRPRGEQRYSGVVRAVRVGQPDQNTTRIAIELQPGYRIDPASVRVRSLSPTRWTVELASPIAVGTTAPAQRSRPRPTPQNSTPLNSEPDRPWVPGALREVLERSGSQEPIAQIEGVDLSEGGLALRVNGGQPAATVTRSADRRQISIVLDNATIANGVDRLVGGRAGVTRMIITPQRGGYPPQVRVLLIVDPQSPDWQVRTDGTLVVAQPIGSTTAVNPPQPDTRPQPPRNWPRQPTDNPSGWTNDAPDPRTGGLPTLNRRVRIVVDPGHGGHDSGAVGIGGLLEKQAVLDISLQLAALLRRQGAEVVMTRDDDTFISLDGRTQMANRLNATVFVSVHANSAGIGRTDVSGIETYYHQSGGRLAQSVHQSIMQAFPYMRNRGVRTARFYVLRNSRMPSILVETGFVTGSQDAALLSNPTWRSQMAWAIARGTIQYLNGR